jgi:hypothetical protein
MDRSPALSIENVSFAYGKTKALDDVTFEVAPVEGFLHQHNTLDTLGADAPESACAAGP